MSTLKETLSNPRQPASNNIVTRYASVVTLTPEQAREVVSALDQLEAAIEAVVSQAKAIAKNYHRNQIAPTFGGTRFELRAYINKQTERTWQDFLTDEARAVLVAAGKIKE